MKDCFTCRFQNIQETSHEWIECKCKLDGKWHNPFRPEIYFDKDCRNWQGEGEKNEQNNDK